MNPITTPAGSLRPGDGLASSLDAPIEGDHSLRALSRAAMDRVSTRTPELAHEANLALQQRAHELAEQMRHARDSSAEAIRAHPLRAVAMAAGIGAGLVLLFGLLARLRGPH